MAISDSAVYISYGDELTLSLRNKSAEIIKKKCCYSKNVMNRISKVKASAKMS